MNSKSDIIYDRNNGQNKLKIQLVITNHLGMF